MIRDRIQKFDLVFQNSLVGYLEDLCNSGFMTGDEASVKAAIKQCSTAPRYVDPIRTLPTPPPSKCSHANSKCRCQEKVATWFETFKEEVDTILYKSNRHSCSRGGCKKNKRKSCKAHFPREIRATTEVSSSDGYIELQLFPLCKADAFWFPKQANDLFLPHLTNGCMVFLHLS